MSRIVSGSASAGADDEAQQPEDEATQLLGELLETLKDIHRTLQLIAE